MLWLRLCYFCPVSPRRLLPAPDSIPIASRVHVQLLSEIHGNAFIELCGRYADGDTDSDLDSSSADDAEEKSAAERRAAARRAEVQRARLSRQSGCGAAIARDFVTYFENTYKPSNPLGRHVTGRSCPRCAAAAGGGAARGCLLDSTVDFGESPGGFPWGPNPVHNVAAAKWTQCGAQVGSSTVPHW